MTVGIGRAWQPVLKCLAAYVSLGMLVLLILLLVNARTGIIERYLIYLPASQLVADPSQYGLPYEDISFSAADGVQLHGWFVPGRSDVTWLWFHGNGGNISHRLDNLRILHDRLGVNVFLFDYRGYGASEGVPTEAGLYMDAQAALEYLRSRDDISEEMIIYFGRSLGSAVAIDLALHHRPYALIIESAFPSMAYMARRTYPFLPLGPFLYSEYDSLAKVPEIESPTLVLHGDSDSTVPVEAGREIYDAASGPREFHTIPGAEHNDGYLKGGEPYFDAMRTFMERLPGRWVGEVTGSVDSGLVEPSEGALTAVTEPD